MRYVLWDRHKGAVCTTVGYYTKGASRNPDVLHCLWTVIRIYQVMVTKWTPWQSQRVIRFAALRIARSPERRIGAHDARAWRSVGGAHITQFGVAPPRAASVVHKGDASHYFRPLANRPEPGRRAVPAGPRGPGRR